MREWMNKEPFDKPAINILFSGSVQWHEKNKSDSGGHIVYITFLSLKLNILI